MDLNLKVEKVFGGYSTLKSLEGQIIKEKDLLKKIDKEESQFYIQAKGQCTEVIGYDYTGIFNISRYLNPEITFAYTEIKNKYKIKLYRNIITPQTNLSLEGLARTLKSYLKLIKKKVAIAYSGGLDSSLLAWVFRDLEPLLITVGFEGSEDIMISKERAKMMGLEHLIHIIEVKELKESLNKVYDLGFSVMELALASGFYIVGKIAKENGKDVLLVGQLADELFGGYRKYNYITLDKLEDVLDNDIKKAIAGMRRDSKAIFYAGVEPIYPYAFKTFFRNARGLPLVYKVNKLGLRKIGEILGMPREIIYARKKAFQYGSKIEKEIKHLLH